MTQRENARALLDKARSALTTAHVELGNADEQTTIEQYDTAYSATVDAMLACNEIAGVLSRIRAVKRSDTVAALDGAVDAMLDSGDLDVDDAPEETQSRRTRLATEANWTTRDPRATP